MILKKEKKPLLIPRKRTQGKQIHKTLSKKNEKTPQNSNFIQYIIVEVEQSHIVIYNNLKQWNYNSHM